MDDKNKLFVFEKKEVILIFLFIILIAVISFTLGVRTGKELSLKHDSYSAEDIKSIDLKSVEEEDVENVVTEKATDFEKSMDKGTSPEEDSTENMEDRLREEMEKLAKEEIKIEPQKKKIAPEVTKEDTEVTNSDTEEAKNEFSGKYTIQLFSHQSQEAAHEFADVFRLKGYDVLINEVVIPGKGKWYRVSIGIFGNMNEAKNYLDNEKKLFQSNKYIIQQI
ncbi:MAG: cell division septation protein DedD [Bacteriovoracaceae bacterium]|jgi:cell division septation protein DedD